MDMQSKQAHMEKVESFAETVKTAVIEEAKSLCSSGAFDADDFDPDHFALAKILVVAAVKRVMPNFMPLDKGYRAMVHNLENI